MKKIVVMCVENHSHHHHIYPVIKNIVDNKLAMVKLLCLRNSDIGIFKEFIGNPLFELVYPSMVLSSVEGLIRTFRSFAMRKTDYQLMLMGSFDILRKSDIFITTEFLDFSSLVRNEIQIKKVVALHGPPATKYGSNFEGTLVDLVICPGDSSTQGLDKRIISRAGPIKLDYFKSQVEKIKIFDNDLPTVYFNPHYSAELGACAWLEHGIKTLDYFSRSTKYNLVFAPHPNLKLKYDLSVCQSYANFSNIIVDIDSPRLSNLFYTANCDIYLGDISSSVYEFIYLEKRKVILFRSFVKDEQLKNIYRFSYLIDSIEEIESKINDCDYVATLLGEQEIAIMNTFYDSGVSSIIASRDILK